MFAAIIIIVHREGRKETHVYLVLVEGQALCLHSAQLILCNSQDNSRKVVLCQRRRKGFKSIRDMPRVTPLWGYSAHPGHMDGCSLRGLRQSGEVRTCSKRRQTSAAQGSGGGGGDVRTEGVAGLTQEFRGKKLALSPTGTGEPPPGHKQGVT